MRSSIGEQSTLLFQPWSSLNGTCSIEEIAKKKNVSMAVVATAWALHKDGQFEQYHLLDVSAILILYNSGITAPIIGTTSLDNLKDLIGK